MGKTDKQAKTQAKVSPISGVAPPKKYQFGQKNGNPQGHGFWRKEDTGRYKLMQMMKMSRAELVELVNDDNAPLFERKIAKNMLKNDEWKVVQDMINQESGMPKQDITSGGNALVPTVTVKFAEPTKEWKSEHGDKSQS